MNCLMSDILVTYLVLVTLRTCARMIPNYLTYEVRKFCTLAVMVIKYWHHHRMGYIR